MIDVYINDTLCVSDEWKQYKFPKSKKKRIRNKWAKATSNYRITKVHRAIKMGNTMIVSSNIYKKLTNNIPSKT